MHDHPIKKRLGTTVRVLREARDWSRRELARHSGVSERYLADVENGTANPSLLRLLQLAEVFGMSVPDLLGGSTPIGVDGRPLHVSLLGLRGAGKSTVGPRLAAQLHRRFVELDARIEASTGLQLSEMFQVHGETYYRQAERSVLEKLLAEPEACVLAVGGGLVAEPASFALLRSRTITVWLQAAPEEHWERVRAQGDTRPMADNERAFADLTRILSQREPFYRQADITVATSGRSIADIVAEIAKRLDGRADAVARDGEREAEAE